MTSTDDPGPKAPPGSDRLQPGPLSSRVVRLDDGLTLKAAVMNEQRAERPIHANDRVWLSWTPEAGVLLMD